MRHSASSRVSRVKLLAPKISFIAMSFALLTRGKCEKIVEGRRCSYLFLILIDRSEICLDGTGIHFWSAIFYIDVQRS